MAAVTHAPHRCKRISFRNESVLLFFCECKVDILVTNYKAQHYSQTGVQTVCVEEK